ncbi:MAG: radical SAM protein [Candidatus Odinarchaeia archaeon]
MKYAHCQNYDISYYPDNGVKVTPIRLSKIAASLKHDGALNINYVGGDPTPNIPTIIANLRELDANIAQLWNSNMYLTKEALSLLLDIIDIWLPDLKYGSDKCALRISKISNYWSTVTENIKIAYIKSSGNVIIRVLVLPNHHLCCVEPILKWIKENTPNALVNIMRQYRPMWLVQRNVEKYKDIIRPPSNKEMEKAYSLADKLELIWRPVS